MSQRYFERIGFSGDSEPLIADIAAAYDIGQVTSSGVLEMGYEDCNVRVETDQGKFVVKAFASLRQTEEVERYVGIMEAVVERGVNHPALHKTSAEKALFIHPSGVSLVLMDFIEGRTFYETKTVPNDTELSRVMTEAVKIHALDLDPPELFDSWAVQHMSDTYDMVEKVLDDNDKKLIQQAMDRYDAIDLSRLTQSFVHGDITSTNSLKGDDGKIWILDFAVANTYPKIQEIAVIAANLLHDPHGQVDIAAQTERAHKAYLGASGILTDYDQEALSDYVIAAVAMEFLGGVKVKYIDKEDPEESEHWIKLGRAGLREALG